MLNPRLEDERLRGMGETRRVQSRGASSVFDGLSSEGLVGARVWAREVSELLLELMGEESCTARFSLRVSEESVAPVLSLAELEPILSSAEEVESSRLLAADRVVGVRSPAGSGLGSWEGSRGVCGLPACMRAARSLSGSGESPEECVGDTEPGVGGLSMRLRRDTRETSTGPAASSPDKAASFVAQNSNDVV